MSIDDAFGDEADWLDANRGRQGHGRGAGRGSGRGRGRGAVGTGQAPRGDQDATSPVGIARPNRARHPFRTTAALTVAVLGVVAGGLGWASATEPPRIRGLDADPLELVSTGGAMVELRFASPIRDLDPGAVRIEPAVPVAARADGAIVTLTFREPLDYATTYHVTVAAAVRGALGSGDATAEFRTADARVDTIVRDVGASGSAPVTAETRRAFPDRVTRADISRAASATTIFEAPVIREYAATEHLVAAITETDGGGTDLDVRVIDTGARVPLRVSPNAQLSHLGVSETGDYLAWVATGPSILGPGYDHTLLTVPLDDPGAPPTVMSGADGAPLRVASWLPVPGGSAMLVRTVDGDVLRVDARGRGQTEKFGQASALLGVTAHDGSPRVVPPSASPSDVAQARASELLGDGSTATLRRTGTREDVVVEGSGTEPVAPRTLTTIPPTERVLGMCVSPNGRLLAVQTVPRGQGGEEPMAPATSTDAHTLATGGATTRFFRIADGNSPAGLPGSAPSWCGTTGLE